MFVFDEKKYMYLWIKVFIKYVVFEKVIRYCLKDVSEVNKLYIVIIFKMVKNNLEFIVEVIVKLVFFLNIYNWEYYVF